MVTCPNKSSKMWTKLVNKYGEKILHDIAKLNFSNTDRILKEVRK